MKIIVESFSKCTAEVTPIKQTLIVKVDHVLHIHLVEDFLSTSVVIDDLK